MKIIAYQKIRENHEKFNAMENVLIFSEFSRVFLDF